MKRCSKCEADKEATLENFYASKSTKDGLGSWCKSCHSLNSAARYKPKRPTPRPEHSFCAKCGLEKLLEDFGKRKYKGQERTASWCKVCQTAYSDTKYIKKMHSLKEGYKICSVCEIEKIATSDFFHNSKVGKNGLNPVCKLCTNQKSYKWRSENLEKSQESSKKTQIKRKYKRRSYARKYYYTKEKFDPFRRACRNIRKRAKEIMGTDQYSITMGCSGTQLKQHLESQFLPGMAWNNYGLGPGKWQIDHKLALAEAYLHGEEAFKEACHYDNLQPLWHEAHLKKTIEDTKRYKKSKNLIIDNPQKSNRIE